MEIRIGDAEFVHANDPVQEIELKSFEEEENELSEKELEEIDKLEPIKIPDKYIDFYLKDFDCVVVNDFGDDYHLSEEEKKKKIHNYELFSKLNRYRGRTKDLKTFVEHSRLCLTILDEIASTNGFYDPDEFKHLYFKGKLYINGLVFPKLTGKKKRVIDWKYISDFILSDEPIEALIDSSDVDDVYTSEELESYESLLFDDINELITDYTEEEKEINSMELDAEEDEELHFKSGHVIPLTGKELKSINKNIPGLLNAAKEVRRSLKSVNNASRYIYNLSADDFEQISSKDAYHNSKIKVPQFTGDIMDADAFNRYLQQLEDFEYSQVKVYHNGKFLTQEEIDVISNRRSLEELGYDLRELYDNREREKILDKIKKEEKRREKELKAKIVNMKNRSNARRKKMGEMIEESMNSSKKKKKKSKKKKKKKKDSP